MKINLTLLLVILTMTIFAQQGWQYQNSSLTTNEYGAIYALSKDSVFVVADNGIFAKTIDGGTTWVDLNTGYSESFFDLCFVDADTGYCAGENGKIVKTIDGGTSWTELFTGTTKNIFSIYLKSTNEIWAVGDSGVILNSVDYGLTWNQDSIINKRLNSIGFKDSVGIIVGNDGTLLKTINYGESWTIENSTTTNDLYSLCITPNYAYALSGWTSDESDFNYYFNASEILKTDDFTNWTTIFIGSVIPGLSRMFFVNDSTGFNLSSNCTTNGDCGIIIRKSEDFAINWGLSFDNWNPPAGWVGIEYSDLFFVNDTIGYALCGNNILKTTDGGVLVGIKKIEESDLIKMYPNPLSNGILNYENNTHTKVGLEIYDYSGKLLIKTILGNSQENINLSNLNNGIYMVKLFHGNLEYEMKKLIILK
jgi:photosystem II stability/assembly factor-like uncharacterized protein